MAPPRATPPRPGSARSEEHTSELQSRVDLVCRLLLEKKNRLRGRGQRGDGDRDPRRDRDAARRLPALGAHEPPFFFNDTATTEIYTLSLHDALPISPGLSSRWAARYAGSAVAAWRPKAARLRERSEEHTSELQSRVDLVCRLLL